MAVRLIRSRRGLLGKLVNMIVDAYTEIDPAAPLVMASGGTTLPYTFLVIATGSRNNPDEVSGLAADRHHFNSADTVRLLSRSKKAESSSASAATSGTTGG